MRTVLAALLCLAVAGCSSRSISDADNRNDLYRSKTGYVGELSEADVLATQIDVPLADADIAAALSRSRLPFHVPRGGRLMVVQSGAQLPDAELLDAFRDAYGVTGFSGVTGNDGWRDTRVQQPNATSRMLRMTAAQGGYSTLAVVWGRLETQQTGSVVKAVSWVPVMGWVLPDQTQTMRIRLRIAVIDVASGRWELFEPAEFEDNASSAILTREQFDHSQVVALKAKAYHHAAVEFIKRYAS